MKAVSSLDEKLESCEIHSVLRNCLISSFVWCKEIVSTRANSATKPTVCPLTLNPMVLINGSSGSYLSYSCPGELGETSVPWTRLFKVLPFYSCSNWPVQVFKVQKDNEKQEQKPYKTNHHQTPSKVEWSLTLCCTLFELGRSAKQETALFRALHIFKSGTKWSIRKTEVHCTKISAPWVVNPMTGAFSSSRAKREHSQHC